MSKYFNFDWRTLMSVEQDKKNTVLICFFEKCYGAKS